MYNHMLDTFLQVADSKSFSRAGKALFLSTVSVMNQINKLEKALGVTLFERTSHGVVLTAAGRSLYKDAKRLIRLSDEVVRRTQHAAESSWSTIRIGTSVLRPCKELLNLWERADDGTHPFQIRIVPFEDDPGVINQLLSSPEQGMDCLVGPCDSIQWKSLFQVQPLGFCRYCFAVSKKNPLSAKKRLTFRDLSGQQVMFLKRGISPTSDKIRDEVEARCPDITIVEMPNFYHAEVFNTCAERGCIMESLDIWDGVHPSVAAIPAEWDYQAPYGIIYTKNPSDALLEFIDLVMKQKTAEPQPPQ